MRNTTAARAKNRIKRWLSMRAGLPFGWNWIEATFVPGVTARNPAYRQIAAVQKSVALDCLDGVMRAGGMEPTMWSEERTDAVLIGADQGDQDSTHGCFSMVSQARARVANRR